MIILQRSDKLTTKKILKRVYREDDAREHLEPNLLVVPYQKLPQ